MICFYYSINQLFTTDIIFGIQNHRTLTENRILTRITAYSCSRKVPSTLQMWIWDAGKQC